MSSNYSSSYPPSLSTTRSSTPASVSVLTPASSPRRTPYIGGKTPSSEAPRRQAEPVFKLRQVVWVKVGEHFDDSRRLWRMAVVESGPYKFSETHKVLVGCLPNMGMSAQFYSVRVEDDANNVWSLWVSPEHDNIRPDGRETRDALFEENPAQITRYIDPVTGAGHGRAMNIGLKYSYVAVSRTIPSVLALLSRPVATPAICVACGDAIVQFWKGELMRRAVHAGVYMQGHY